MDGSTPAGTPNWMLQPLMQTDLEGLHCNSPGPKARAHDATR
jgi:hypothetical protein